MASGTNMTTWAVAFLSLHGGEIKQMVVNADSKLEAYREFLWGTDWRESLNNSALTAEAVEEMVFDGDCYISAIKIST